MQSTPIRTCGFCGRELEPITVTVMGKTYDVGYYDCLCSEAVKKSREEEAEKAAQQEIDRRLNRMKKILKAGIPERFVYAKTDNANLIADALAEGLYIQGPVGTGKTHLASAIGIAVIDDGFKVLFVKAYQLTTMLSSFEHDDEAVSALKRPDLLIIDDLGMQMANAWENSRMRIAIDARYDADKPVIITSNYSKQELYERIEQTNDKDAAAIVSRLFGMTRKEMLDGKDRRMQ